MACCVCATELERNIQLKKKQLLEVRVNRGIESRMTVFIVIEYCSYAVINLI